MIGIADQIVTKKINAFQTCINKEIGNIFEYVQILKAKLQQQMEDNLKLGEVIQKYEHTVIKSAIR